VRPFIRLGSDSLALGEFSAGAPNASSDDPAEVRLAEIRADEGFTAEGRIAEVPVAFAVSRPPVIPAATPSRIRMKFSQLAMSWL
jgi:hypothetical protein